MTNHHFIVADGSDEPVVAERMIQIRGYYSDFLVKIVKEHGWETAAECVCTYCRGFIVENSPYTDNPVPHTCECSEVNRRTESSRPPV